MSIAILPRSFGTHDGTFHADEVTACALLLVADRIDSEKVVRSREPDLLEACEYVCDVGGEYNPVRKRFDHHQADYLGPLSSAGMVLSYLESEGAMSSEQAAALREALVDGVDAHDNGRVPQNLGCCTFSHVVSNFAPIQRDETSEIVDAAFMSAVDFVVGHLKRFLMRTDYVLSCRSMVEEAMKQQGDCLLFEENIPWLESFFSLGGENHPARFIIMPSGQHWKLRGVPPSYADRMKVRQPLPQAWAGLLEGELSRLTGIPGGVFCHKGRFISVWETKEDALKAYELIK